MAIDPEFLRDIQRKGWIIVAADGEAVLSSCPRDGCTVRLKLRPGVKVPDTCARGPDLLEIAVDTFDNARVELRDRREGLALTIRDVEACAGLGDDHLAKIEGDNATRLPNISTFLLWVQTLGYDLVLRPGALPPITLRTLAETRDKLQVRRAKIRIHKARRSSRT